MAVKIAIIGRPNVGKSTLFNRLTKSAQAIVNDTAGVTRDYKEAEANIADLRFTLIDTAGLEQVKGQVVASKMFQGTLKVVKNCQLVLMVIDGTIGVTAEDLHFARMLRNGDKDVIVIANKCESSKRSQAAIEAYNLGFDQVVFMSAAHGDGIVDLYEAITNTNTWKNHEQRQQLTTSTENKENTINLAILGRPNAGKSTFVNTLLGDERLITDATAGTTSDAIAVSWQYHDVNFNLIDTA
ncbi:MAG: GTPase, partial [Pseudomonadota bacterium]